jgi:hypothetical protein
MSTPATHQAEVLGRHPVVLSTWVYNGAGGSVLMVAIWHALFDLVTASKAGQDVIPIVATAGVIAWALFVANVNKPWGLRFQEKHTLWLGYSHRKNRTVMMPATMAQPANRPSRHRSSRGTP